jgi:hypothetical protein
MGALVTKINKKYTVQFALKVDFLSLIYQAMWGLKTQVSTPESSGCRPNLWEWWVGEKISLDNGARQWVVDGHRQSKKE